MTHDQEACPKTFARLDDCSDQFIETWEDGAEWWIVPIIHLNFINIIMASPIFGLSLAWNSEMQYFQHICRHCTTQVFLDELFIDMSLHVCHFVFFSSTSGNTGFVWGIVELLFLHVDFFFFPPLFVVELRRLFLRIHGALTGAIRFRHWYGCMLFFLFFCGFLTDHDGV